MYKCFFRNRAQPVQNLFRDFLNASGPLSLMLSKMGFQFLKNFKGLSLSQKRIALIWISPIMLCVHFERLGAYQKT